jgi:hypothetical protein
MEYIGRPLAITILLAQLAVLVAFSNRRLLLFLFTFYDIMHLGIFVLVGANFWTWFMLNLAIIAAAKTLQRGLLNWKTGVFGAAVILASNSFAQIAHLGWYDTTAINSAYFEVVHPGGRTRVPATAFGFYSYPVAHMSFGLPPGHYFPTLTNGGTLSSAVYRQSTACVFDSPHSKFEKKWNAAVITQFINAYHQYFLERLDSNGHWSNDFYPHHFWAAPSVVRNFAAVDLREVTDYVLVIESACLDPKSGDVIRIAHTNEFWINVAK